MEKQSLRGKTYAHLLDLSPEEVEQYDIAELNLLCGSGLNGTENVDINECLENLELLVEMVRQETKRNWHRWENNPSEYLNSEAYYKMGMLITVIRQDFDTNYNADLITDPKKPEVVGFLGQVANES